MTRITPLFWLLSALVLGACVSPPPAPAPAPPPPPPAAPPPVAEAEPESLGEYLARIEAAYRRGDYERGLALVKRVLELEQTDVSALDRVGSIYYALGRYGEALTMWQRALPLEKEPRRRRQLENSISVARRSLGLGGEAPRPRPRKRPAPRRRADPAQLESLYQAGLKHYARGEYLQASAQFLRMLELEPKNAKAEAALERLRLDPER